MAEIKTIKEIKVKLENRYNGPNTSKNSIKSILKENGYTEKQIQEMKAEQRILIEPELRLRIRSGQRLFVIDKKIIENPKTEERFSDLDEA